MLASAQAQANIALIKYWGKRDSGLNLPASGSLSITLDALWTRTRIQFDPAIEKDEFILNGAPASPEQRRRVRQCLDLFSAFRAFPPFARISSRNNFPTGAGLASSASGFAALVVAAAAALQLDLTSQTLSGLARRGSGSAARSLFGGFVEMARGTRSDGTDSVAQPLLDAGSWPLEVIIAVTSEHTKAVGSTSAMDATSATSPFYAAWVEGAENDLQAARHAILNKDFEALAEVSEASCLKMHAAILSGRPGLIYWNGATVECLHRVRELRLAGLPVFFTVDAGPQVKAVCTPVAVDRVSRALADVPGVRSLLHSRLGPGAIVLPDTMEVGNL